VGFAPLRRMRSVSPLDAGLPQPAMVPLVPFCTTSAACSSHDPPDFSGNTRGVSRCLQGFSLTRIVCRCRLPPLLTFPGSTFPRFPCVSRGLFPVRVRCRRPMVGARSLLGVRASPGSRCNATTLPCCHNLVFLPRPSIIQPSPTRPKPDRLPAGDLALEVLMTLQPDGPLRPSSLVKFLP